ncbi:MAG: DEAD/DEAH box helicase [Saprospiraceae bacterium]
MGSFKELGLSDEILKVLTEIGFEEPSDIQAEAIPQLMDGERDFIGLAQTGTGKTAAFGLPLLERIDAKNSATQGLVLAPTRELGQQIAEQLYTFSKYLKQVNVLAVYGGAAIMNQIKALRKPQHVIIATPGRLIDLIKRKAVNLEELKFLVLDEADEMLNMGFKDELDQILSYTPDEKSTWLFSATMPNEIKRIVKMYMDDPIEVRVNAKMKVNANIEHQFVTIRHSSKTAGLTRFLDLTPDIRAVVFCRTRRETQSLAEELLKRDYKADALHGDLSQAQRDRVMKRFKTNDLQVLIATDVAARGIDVNDLTHVFHYDLPDDHAYYTHRSGRTARAGKKGISIALVGGRETMRIARFEKQLGISFKKVLVPKLKEIMEVRLKTWSQTILEQKVPDNIDEQLVADANTELAALSKEDLILKLLASELEKLNRGAANDRIETERERSGGDRKRPRWDRKGGRDRKSRHRGSRDGRDRYRDRERDRDRSKDRDRDRSKDRDRDRDRDRSKDRDRDRNDRKDRSDRRDIRENRDNKFKRKEKETRAPKDKEKVDRVESKDRADRADRPERKRKRKVVGKMDGRPGKDKKKKKKRY